MRLAADVDAAPDGDRLVAPLAGVWARCRGLWRREYEDGLRLLDRIGLMALERASPARELTDDDRAAAIADARGILVAAVLLSRT